MNEIIIGKIRVQAVCGGVLRIERAADGKFCNEKTLIIPGRDFTAADFTVKDGEGYKEIFAEGFTLCVPCKGDTLSGIKILNSEGKTIYRYKKLKNSGELPTADKTPEVFALSDNPRITVPEHGYSYCGDTDSNGYKIDESAEDIYLLLCKRDARLLRRLYVEITGRSELVRLSTLGLWDSKYFEYDEQSARSRIEDYKTRGVPLDNIVIDTDWRTAERGVGYEVNDKLFPDIKRFFDFAHSRGVNVMFNDHPEPVAGAESLLSPAEIKYREENLQKLMSLGLDIWWYDRNWSVALKAPEGGILPETWGAYAFGEITKNFYKKRDGEYYTRPDIMANANNIYHGNYCGAYGVNNKGLSGYSANPTVINDSISHRYSVQWTGDIASDCFSIVREIGNMLGGGNNCLPYVNADCGGHTGNPDKRTYVRWMQFGAFSPVFRPHCTKSVIRSREPWAYDEETFEIVNGYIKMRYRLLPVIYRQAYESWLNGTPVFAPLAFDFPADRKAAKCNSEYTLGGNILVAPVAHNVGVRKLDTSNYVSGVEATYYNGTELEGEPILKTRYNELFKFWWHEKPHPEVPAYNFSARYKTRLRFDKDVNLFIDSDDGATVYVDGKKVHEDKGWHAVQRANLGVLKGGRIYDIEIEYFQAGGEAAIALLFSEAVCDVDGPRNVYLPEGRWVDVFNGKIHNGGKAVKRECRLYEMPLFVRTGAFFPLAEEAENTQKQIWDKLVFDFYPDKQSCDSGYLYEDDGRTVAYKRGECRKCAYSACFNEKENAFVINFDKARGGFSGERAVEERETGVRIHLLDGLKINRVTVNGENVYVSYTEKGIEMPFNGGDETPDGKCALFNFKQSVSENYIIKIYVD